MYSGDNTCRKKILFICSFFLSVLLSFACALRPLAANALAPNVYQIYFNIYGYDSGNYFWGPEINANETFYASNVKRYQWKINSLTYSGNYAAIHFETNIVIPDVGSQFAIFSNLDNLFVSFCGSGGSNGTIRSSSVTTAKTVWYSNNNTTENLTLTIYGSAVVSGLQYTSGSHDLYCGIATQNAEPFIRSPSGNTPHFYIEQSPTSVQFTNDINDALIASQNDILTNIDNSINNVYEQQKQDELNKQDELEDQADGLSLSADNISNPFTSLFQYANTSYSSCVTMTKISSWFNISPAFQVCSPYPASIYYLLRFVNFAFIFMLIVRVYIKHLKGGVNG